MDSDNTFDRNGVIDNTLDRNGVIDHPAFRILFDESKEDLKKIYRLIYGTKPFGGKPLDDLTKKELIAIIHTLLENIVYEERVRGRVWDGKVGSIPGVERRSEQAMSPFKKKKLTSTGPPASPAVPSIEETKTTQTTIRYPSRSSEPKVRRFKDLLQ